MLKFLKQNKEMTPLFWSIVEKYFKRAMVIVENRTKIYISSMHAVATGYMRKNIVAVVKVNAKKRVPIEAILGTKAYYDILVHEGLGRHSPTGELPANFQEGPVVPSLAVRKKYWKPSPKVPRPFFKYAIRDTRTMVTDIIRAGFREASKKYLGTYGAGSKPRHKLSAVMGGMK